MDTAVRALWLIMDTKMLSTMLYMAWTSMEMTMGKDIVTSRRLTGMVPILFSCVIDIILLFPLNGESIAVAQCTRTIVQVYHRKVKKSQSVRERAMRFLYSPGGIPSFSLKTRLK